MNVKVKAKYRFSKDSYGDIYGLEAHYSFSVKGIYSGKGSIMLINRGYTTMYNFLKAVAKKLSNSSDNKELIKKEVISNIENLDNEKLVERLMKDGLSFEFDYKPTI